jgi:hypothetical protein
MLTASVKTDLPTHDNPGSISDQLTLAGSILIHGGLRNGHPILVFVHSFPSRELAANPALYEALV